MCTSTVGAPSGALSTSPPSLPWPQVSTAWLERSLKMEQGLDQGSVVQSVSHTRACHARAAEISCTGNLPTFLTFPWKHFHCPCLFVRSLLPPVLGLPEPQNQPLSCPGLSACVLHIWLACQVCATALVYTFLILLKLL